MTESDRKLMHLSIISYNCQSLDNARRNLITQHLYADFIGLQSTGIQHRGLDNYRVRAGKYHGITFPTPRTVLSNKCCGVEILTQFDVGKCLKKNVDRKFTHSRASWGPM